MNSEVRSDPLVTIIVPIKNSSKNISSFLDSLLRSTYKRIEIVVNDDKTSTDNSLQVIEKYRNKGLAIQYVRENTGMSQARKQGATHAKGSILMHLDSDMEVSPDLIAECVSILESKNAEGLVIPEQSFGQGFWARCKILEKQCYQGVEQLESLRCLYKATYIKLGGHNEKLLLYEDKDFDLRFRAAGLRITHTEAVLHHNEGKVKFSGMMRKRAWYTPSILLYEREHPKEYRWQVNPINRFGLFLRNYQLLFEAPLTYLGMYFLKASEYTLGAVVLFREKV